MIKTIMLVCSAGMSTSLLVEKMKIAAKEKGMDIDIFAVGVSAADTNLANHDVDVLMFGPQVRYLLKDYEKKLADTKIKVKVINMMDYGQINGKKVLESALEE